jgi:hypothetical protein
MPTWFDVEMEVLRRHDQANKLGRTPPPQLPEERTKQPSLLARFLGWLSRRPRPEPTEEPKPVLRPDPLG